MPPTLSDQGDVGWFTGLFSSVSMRAVIASCKTLLFGRVSRPAPSLMDASTLAVTQTRNSSNSELEWRFACPENSVHLLTESSSQDDDTNPRSLITNEPLVRSILSQYGHAMREASIACEPLTSRDLFDKSKLEQTSPMERPSPEPALLGCLLTGLLQAITLPRLRQGSTESRFLVFEEVERYDGQASGVTSLKVNQVALRPGLIEMKSGMVTPNFLGFFFEVWRNQAEAYLT
ncbi:hypothetical protein BIW11_09711 [Tropilaelaps mercedesae]|uniref:Uncharacterized protein n=1 Tax=Tropilaelaps mercedesae TaxID=418985 RepID=A0A1V9XIX5_9ACAR|nr:hypothetical protein BIW11_09711 [Tropilaelaps mercedesae]